MNGLLPQFERTHILLGDAGLAKLAQKHVFVAGLGGVGSYCAEALARAGVGRLTLLDHDVVATSNINRQLPALLSTVGQSKAELMRARIMDINPECRLEILRTFLNSENVNELVPECDYVVDAIDSLACKVALVGESVKRGLRVASSMGAGNRLDPGRIKIDDISKTEMCPLAKQMRKRLSRHYELAQGCADGILGRAAACASAAAAGRWAGACAGSERHHQLYAAPVRNDAGRCRDQGVAGVMSATPEISAIVLAGGRGRRMGEVDKGLQLLQGKPLVSWVVDRIAPQVSEVLISANRNLERYREMGYVVLPDEMPGFPGPLAGLRRAMSEVNHPLWLSVPCDTPFLPEDLVQRLYAALMADKADLAVATVEGQMQPTICLGYTYLHAGLGDFLARGGRRVSEWQSGLHRTTALFSDLQSFRNINAQADLKEAETVICSSK